LNLLPRKSTGATEWGVIERDEHIAQSGCCGEELREGIDRANERLSMFYSAVCRPVLLSYPGVFASDWFTIERVRWAHGMLLSRALVLPGPMEAVCPFLDLINHGRGEKLAWSRQGDEIVVRTQREMQGGEQVLIDYGAQNGLQTMLHHGFLDPP